MEVKANLERVEDIYTEVVKNLKKVEEEGSGSRRLMS
jgi:hypothetical protein